MIPFLTLLYFKLSIDSANRLSLSMPRASRYSLLFDLKFMFENQDLVIIPRISKMVIDLWFSHYHGTPLQSNP